MNINFSNYGQERERIATESEIEIFNTLCSIVNSDDLKLVRKSDNYVTAAIGDWDLARFKYTPRAKWIMFPLTENGTNKIKISEPSDVYNYVELAADSLTVIKKYSD